MPRVKHPDLIQVAEAGLYCPQGDFYIDPWKPVDRALVTHAHSDHARHGCGRYLAAQEGLPILRLRLGPGASIQTAEYGESLSLGSLKVSLHPAGHIAGSAQVRLEHKGRVWVLSGDYKSTRDPTCRPFEPVRCQVFVTESTFGLPIFRWPAQETVFQEINQWWKQNQKEGRASLLLAYAVGKAQRALAGMDSSIGPVMTHGAVEKVNRAYRQCGIALPQTQHASQFGKKFDWSQALIIAPPSANGTPWMRRLGNVSTGFASGWMTVSSFRRGRSVERGFVLSDHVDWPQLNLAIQSTRAEEVWAIHGYTAQLTRYLKEQGYRTREIQTRFAERGNENS